MSCLPDSRGRLLAPQPPFPRSHFFGLINPRDPRDSRPRPACPRVLWPWKVVSGVGAGI